MAGILGLLMSGAGLIKDQYFNLTTLLLPGNGTNGAQNNTFLDSSSNNFTITRNGNTTQGTFSPFSQTGWGNYFNGSSYLQLASNSVLNMNTYCAFELWVNYSSLGTSTLIAGRDASYFLGYNFTAIGGAANKFVFTINNGSSWQAVSSSTTPVVGVWYHVLGVKDNNTLRIYINGIQENTAVFSGSPVTGATVFGIASNQNTQNMAGYVSNVRLVLGASSSIFPYSGLTTGSNITVPVSPLTNVSGTALLTCQSNRFVDNSSSPLTITANGSPSVVAFSPFAPTAAYTTAAVGGSGYFDGSGDYLTATNNAAYDFGTGNFTVETWAYITSYTGGSTDIIISNYQNSTNGWTLGIYNGTGKFYFAIAGDSGQIDDTAALPLNQWVHLVAVRSSTTMSLFVNGTRAATTTNSTNNTSTSVLTIGTNVGGGVLNFNGYLSNTRIVKGTAVYDPTLTMLTVPTAPLTAITNTSLLLNFTNAGITDATAKNDLETVGNAQISTSVSKFGGGSIAFDGTGDYLAIPLSENTGFGTGDFTIEGWAYLNATITFATIISNRLHGSDLTTGRWSLAFRNTALEFFVNGSALISSGTVSSSTWTHFAITRSSNSVRLFLNGTQVGSTTSLTTNLLSLATWIGANGAGTEALNGYIDDLRITRGLARYTANFTVPTAPFPVQ